LGGRYERSDNEGMKRFSVWKLMVAIAILAVCLSYVLVPFSRQVEFNRLRAQMDDSIRNLQPTKGTAVSPIVWDCARNWTITAYGNVCFSRDHVATAEMYRFKDDLDKKLKGKIDLSTLLWIWERLAQTGPHGAQHVEAHRIQLQEYLPPTPAPRILFTNP